MDTHVTFVLDSSGSMQSIREDTIGGFNSFLNEQQSEPGEATVSLYDFDSSVDCLYQGRSIKEAPELDDSTYIPGGRTALYDALFTGVTEAADYLMKEDTDWSPENVVVVVLTDGKENASETSRDQIRNLVTTHQDEYDWEFLFIGANQDAALSASEIGIDENRSLKMRHSGEGAQAAYESASNRVSDARESGTTGGFNQEDRERQEETDTDDR